MSSQNFPPGNGGLRQEFCSSSTNNSKDQDCTTEIKNMCSVLNVVIDQTMEPITPMEAEEWNINKKNGDGDIDVDIEDNKEYSSKKEKYNRLLVPVIRIFGSLLRDPRGQPLQSACLYIHGAFPYILARPVLAGPDGSIYPNPSTTTHVNWDDRDEVEAIQAEIQATLEETLQSSFSDAQGLDSSKVEGDHSRDRNNRQGTDHCPIIRKVTVVEGRGFYTFCPGPSTCFLRIEYYDPKLRWKVKLTMERGLQLPRRYHPDLRRFDRPTTTIDDAANDSLRFNCYEAHIPYTMQFFKDHNLAGMTYIHIRKGKIRGSLSKRYYPRNKELNPAYNCHQIGENSKGFEDAFLESNTHPKFLWPPFSKSNHGDDNTKRARSINKGCDENLQDEDFSSLCYLRPDYSPPQKNSSCDVEIDCTVRDIQNIDDIMTSLPSDQDERDEIQWRAVPSLQEIWREERARMKKLLSPELTQEIIGDLLLNKNSAGGSHNSSGPTTFTLDVKKSAPRSGTKLAVKGMWSLVNVSGGLQEDFIRSLVDILDRHKEMIGKVDQELQEGRAEKANSHTSQRILLQQSPTLRNETEEWMSLLTTPASNREKNPALSRHSTPPTMKEAISALKLLGPNNQDDCPNSVGLHPTSDYGATNALKYMDTPNMTPSEDTPISKQGSKYRSFLDMSYLRKRGTKFDAGQSQVIKALYDPNVLTTPNSETVYSQSTKEGVRLFVEHSQSPSSIFEAAEDLDHVQDATQTFSQPLSYRCTQDMHDETLPKSLDPAEYSQRMERGDYILYTQNQDVEDIVDPDTLAPYNRIDFGEDCCRAIFKVETDLPNMLRICGFRAALCSREGHEFPEKRAHPGVYNTITTGIVVDGVIDSSKYGTGDGDGDNEDCNVLEDFCRRSQKSADSQPEIQRQSTQIPISSRLASALLTQAIEEEPDSDNFETEKPMHLDTVLANNNEGLVYLETPKRSQKRSLVEFLSQTGDLESGISFFSEEDNDRVPNWLARASPAKELIKDEHSMDVGKTRRIMGEKMYFEPKSLAPNRGDVKAWNRMQKKKEIQTAKKSEQTLKKKTMYEVHEIRELKDGDYLDRRKLLRKGKRFEKTPTQDDVLSDKELNKNEHDTSGASSKGSKSLHSTVAHSGIQSGSQESENALDGICNQGGRIFIEGGGGLKAKTRTSNLVSLAEPSVPNLAIGNKDSTSCLASPITMMAVEVHIQCRVGASRLDSKKISMAQDSSKDKISALVYVYARDRGGGESLEILSRGCICLTLEGENPEKDPTINKNLRLQLLRAMPRASMDVRSPLSIDVVKDERHLLRRFKDIVRTKDPDLMLSWDTQGAGLGYIIERGHALGKSSCSAVGDLNRGESSSLDMAKLLGRTPMDKKAANFVSSLLQEKTKDLNLDQINEINENAEQTWQGSGLGCDWDDRVGAGVAAASIVGRLVFAGWKIVAEEVKHPNASYLPAVVFAVLNKRIPHHDDIILTKWYANNPDRWRTLNYRLTQATASLLLFDALDIVGRAGEAARLSGVEFSQSFPGIRGSQYKVEGVLLRALKSLRSDERGSKKGKKAEPDFFTQQTNTSSGSGRTRSQSQSPWKVRRSNMEKEKLHSLEDRQYFFFSPSHDDVKEQEALEVQALTLEPQSGHFTDPVVVCDFTALYPSLIIAYNLCYSTCAGKLDYHSTRREMQMEGRTRGKVGPFVYCERRTATVLNHHLKSLSNISRNDRISKPPNFSRDRTYVAPTGTVYVSESVLKGVLPQVLDEMLTTRAMLKKAAKEYKKNVKNLSPAILRQLEARQLALKYVANVTYGYTSATFSGRCAMPLLADTIVECGRRTLQRAMHIANQWGEGIDPWGKKDNSWLGAEVIYGDTDSLFIRMPGRSYKEAFDFGEQFCKAVTSLNPPPVQLKLEKVYVGSIMQTMKRYCGMKYDSKDQKKPTFEAKGLEIIRRDQCALTQKVLKDALITLFKDGLGAVKEYMCRQWSLIFAGDLPVSNFILTGRVRSKYRGGKEGPVQAVLARRLAEADPGRVVQHKERLAYVIVATPGVTFRLKDCVLTPLELLERWDAYKIHSGYYIEKHVNAALQRCLGLPPHFVTVADWFATCPKPRRRTHFWPIKSKRAMITAYFGNDVCSLCHRKCQADGSNLVVVCRSCKRDRINSVQSASAAMNKIENEANIMAKKCSKCNGCFESAETFAVAIEQEQTPTSRGVFCPFQRQKNIETLLMPLANCVCIDCPTLYQRHRLREQGIEAKGTYNALTTDFTTDW